MFCSNCGKTIAPGLEACAHCGMVIGSGEFTPGAYIASQPHASQGAPDADVKPRYARYTRTTYTTMENSEGGDVFRRTSYRPVLEDEPAPAPAAAREAEPEPPEPPEAPTEAKPEPPKADPPAQGDPDSLPDSGRAQPLRTVRLPGISPQTQERMRRLREQEDARESGAPAAKPARPVVPSLFSGAGRGASTRAPRRDPLAAEEPAEETKPGAWLGEWPSPEGEDVFDTSDIEEEDEEEAPRFRLFRGGRQGAGAPRAAGGVLRTALIALCVVALLIGGFIWLSYRTAARSPITGVTYTLFEQGIAELEAHTAESYRAEILALYAQDPTGATAATKQTEGRARLQALMPGTPLANDQEFLNALLAIQTNVENAITLDGLMAGDTEGALSALGGSSQERWDAIANAITRLKAATDPMALSAIGESSTFSATPTPAPTPTVSPYSTLTKGMKDNADVLKMQNRLYELGWFTDVRDGDFGAVTQTAVKQFQQAVGLSVTGIADPDTLDAMYAEGAPRTGNKVTPAPSPTAEPDPNATAPAETVAPANPN